MEVFQMSLATKLRKFRQQCEREAGTHAGTVELPLAHVLDDVCQTLKLSPKERRKVLGRKASAELKRQGAERIDLNTPVTHPDRPNA
jgi:hypothetical protein